MLQRVRRAYGEALFDTDGERVLQVVRTALAAGAPPEEVLFGVVVPSIEAMISMVGERGATNLAQHFLAAQIASEVVDELLPRFPTPPAVLGTVVLGTAAGDVHGLGKRIVGGCLKAQLIGVADLGLNVSAERFVDEAVARGAGVIAISSMMVHTARGEGGCRAVRRLLRERGLEGQIKVIVGGAPYVYDPELYRKVEADAWAPTGMAAGPAVKRLLTEGRDR